jgi:hypothetical protein
MTPSTTARKSACPKPESTKGPAVTSGYLHDPDLPLPEESERQMSMGGLHTLRHVDRFVQSLGLELVLNAERGCWDDQLGDGYDEAVERRVRRPFRHAGSAGRLRHVLRNDPAAVPHLFLSGSSCVGWRPTWTGVRVGRRLAPGRLFVLTTHMATPKPSMIPIAGTYMCAWQHPFPTHALLAWGPRAELTPGPVELPSGARAAAAWLFESGDDSFGWGKDAGRDAWLRTHRFER